MKFIQNKITDPYFNLALEEYLLRHVSFESCMLWQSRASVVIGKHQNALGEVNAPFVWNEKIPVVRRLSGGGTVFHGPGNLNFTLIREGQPGKLIDFRKYTQPVIDFLNELGVPARFEGKNDIRVNGLKISGNAEHVFKNRVLHHGTLLFDSDLDQLNEAIRITPGRYADKSVQSVRSRVANISEFLPESLSFNEFKNKLELFLKAFFQREQQEKGLEVAVSDHHFNDEENLAVQKLAQEKYATWEWNYGYSPDYTFFGSSRIGKNEVKLRIIVKKGIIRETEFFNTGHNYQWNLLKEDLIDKQHNPNAILQLLNKHSFINDDADSIPSDFMQLFF